MSGMIIINFSFGFGFSSFLYFTAYCVRLVDIFTNYR